MPSLATSLPASALGLAVLLAAAPARAAVPVTTGETDTGFPTFSVVITDPKNDAIIPGNPDAVVPVTIEFMNIPSSEVDLQFDGMVGGTCMDQDSPCILEITLTPGQHTLKATGQAFADEPPIESDPVIVEVVEGAATDTSGAPTTGGSETGASSGSSETATGSATDASAPGDDKGCACTTNSRTPDLLALVLLLLPWRRRALIRSVP